MAERVELRWQGRGMVFEGRRDDRHSIMIDGASGEAVSPLAALLLGVGACTASDVAELASKMRVPIGGFSLVIDGKRVDTTPRRYSHLQFTYRLMGIADPDRAKIERAVSLSHEKYCSALHTLRSDLEVTTAVLFED
jgi:putative redox protein